MKSPIVFNKDDYVVVKCPYCDDFSIMGYFFLSSRQLQDYENHVFSCRKNRLYDTIKVVIDENEELLEKLEDE